MSVVSENTFLTYQLWKRTSQVQLYLSRPSAAPSVDVRLSLRPLAGDREEEGGELEEEDLEGKQWVVVPSSIDTGELQSVTLNLVTKSVSTRKRRYFLYFDD